MTFTADINGTDVSRAGAGDPLVLSPQRGARVHVVVTNASSQDVVVRGIRLESRVLGLAFVTYTTRVDLTVPAGQQGDRTYDVDTSDLAGQATGLLPGRLTLLGDQRQVIADRSLAIDVRGSLGSVYGIFGLAVAGSTVLLLLAALLRLALHRLPDNRWLRAVRFAVPAAGLGLTLTFTLSALRLLSPAPTSSLTFVLVGTAIGLIFGYLTPGPARDNERKADESLLAELLAGRRGEVAAAGQEQLAGPAAAQPEPKPQVIELPESGERQSVDLATSTGGSASTAAAPGPPGRGEQTTAIDPSRLRPPHT